MRKRRKEMPEIEIEDLDPTDIARLLGWTRVLLGACLFFAPRFTSKAWTGTSTDEIPTTLALRGMGVRDMGLGLGLVFALERGAPVRGWLEGAALADAGDAIGTLAAWRDLPKGRAIVLLALEAGSAYVESQLAGSLD